MSAPPEWDDIPREEQFRILLGLAAETSAMVADFRPPKWEKKVSFVIVFYPTEEPNLSLAACSGMEKEPVIRALEAVVERLRLGAEA